jgi:hypothetical protein
MGIRLRDIAPDLGLGMNIEANEMTKEEEEP